jgi:outer membrane lipoprotein SlyB
MKLVIAAIAFAALSWNTQIALGQAGDKGEPKDADASASVCAACGMVTAIRPTALRGEPKWMGTISSGVTGRQPSSATGSGSGYTSPFTGHSATNPLPGQDDLGARQRTIYEVVVLMDDQTTRKLHYEHRPALSVGDKVRVSGGQVYLR